MKKLKTMMVISLLVAPCSFGDEMTSKARRVASLYQQGLIAMNQGKGEKAASSFREVLKLHPGHGHARHHLKILPAKLAQVKQEQRLRKFKTTLIEEIHFHRATLAEALIALEELTVKSTKGDFTPNFLIQDPSGKLQEKVVTLRMNNVPVSAILQYLTQMTHSRVRYDQHATAIKPIAP